MNDVGRFVHWQPKGRMRCFAPMDGSMSEIFMGMEVTWNRDDLCDDIRQCPSCRRLEKKVRSGEMVNSDGNVTRPGRGRFVGMFVCDGPTCIRFSRIPCTGCATMLLDTFKRTRPGLTAKINSLGNVCWVGGSVWTPKFYCGCTYALNHQCKCGTCDGRCGPANGCSCEKCSGVGIGLLIRHSHLLFGLLEDDDDTQTPYEQVEMIYNREGLSSILAKSSCDSIVVRYAKEDADEDALRRNTLRQNVPYDWTEFFDSDDEHYLEEDTLSELFLEREENKTF